MLCRLTEELDGSDAPAVPEEANDRYFGIFGAMDVVAAEKAYLLGGRLSNPIEDAQELTEEDGQIHLVAEEGLSGERIEFLHRATASPATAYAWSASSDPP